MTDAVNSAPAVEYFPPSRPWRDGENGVVLLGMECPRCGTRAFPPRTVCSACSNTEGIREVELSPAGTLYSFSEIHVGPKGFPASYVLGFIDLDDGVRVLGQVEGTAADIELNARVRVFLDTIRTRPNGAPVISYKFRKE